MTSKEIRQKYLDFFASKGHTVVPSAPMVIKNDPTLMFTNAGMNQFKDIFLGNSAPKFPRATDSQKCLRVSGKHNDLEAVGHDGRHHTMFEMLGNWSFGDYFKEEAIDWAWELLTEVYKIDKTKLYATVFEGSEEDGTKLDTEARKAWLKHLPEDHVLTGNKHDNFWEMGDTGPCGPCSEIHIDLRPDEEIAKIPGRELVNTDNDDVIEIWNLVFMQYERKADGHLEPLPAKNIDTGMGFERLCMILQNKKSNYETDVFSGLIGQVEAFSGHKYAEGGNVEVAMRVIADHIRAIAFSIADGQLPSNVKAGYVIRRILRRAVRYGYTFLGFTEPFLCRLIPQLVADMGEAYPELKAQQKLITSVIKEEENAFLRTLDRGIRMLEDNMAKNAATKVVSGTDAFVLYDTYGFPIDLTELIASEKGYTVDLEGFNVELGKQKERARNATANEFGDWMVFKEADVLFEGYDTLRVEGAHLLKQRTVKQKNKEYFQLVFDRTPFYAEMGGQVGDTGYIEGENGERIQILNTVKENNLTIHLAERLPSRSTQAFTLVVDNVRRRHIQNNHTCTHLLHQALRVVLGTHVEQKGSFVGPDYFRFDFSHFQKMTDEELRAVEIRVNQLIRSDFPLIEKRDATMEEARKMGAMALFGEKYGDVVRVVRFGDSVELCGGTHTRSTGTIGLFKIVSESAVAAGVRRIEAVTGAKAMESIHHMEDLLKTIKNIFNNAPDLTGAIEKLVAEHADARKQLEAVASEKAAALAQKLEEGAEEVNGIRLVRFDHSMDPAIVRNVALLLQKKAQNLVLAGAFAFDGKPNLVLMYSNDLVAKGKNAGKDIREAAKFIQGGGGGQPGLATAGGRDIEGLPDALNKLIEALLLHNKEKTRREGRALRSILPVFQSFVGPFLAVLGIVTFILVMQFLWLYIDELVGKGLEFKVILEFLMWGSCQTLPLAIPLATLLSSMMTLGEMGEKFELTAIKASGISLTRVLLPMIIVSILVSIGAFYVGDRLVPYSINQIYTMRDDIGRTKSEIKIPTGTFYDGIEGYILRVERRDKKTGMMYNIQVYDHTVREGQYRITVADSGIIKMSKAKDYLTFQLFDGVNYQEDNKRKYRDTTLALQRIRFHNQEMVIPLENYAFHHSDSARYGEQVRSMNLKDLRHGHDSLTNLVDVGTKRHVAEFRRQNHLEHKDQLDTSWRQGHHRDGTPPEKAWTKSARQAPRPGKCRSQRPPVPEPGQRTNHGFGRLYPPDSPHGRGNLEKIRPGAGLPAAVLHRRAGRSHHQKRRPGYAGHRLHAVLRAVLGGGHHRRAPGQQRHHHGFHGQVRIGLCAGAHRRLAHLEGHSGRQRLQCGPGKILVPQSKK